jgi:predicted dehydrogenase
MRLVIVGFRHAHAAALYQTAKRLEYVDVVACVEEDPAARDQIPAQLGVTLTHDTFEQVLQEVDFDTLACIDYFARRGPVLLKALEAGKHVVTDKPLCIEVDQLRQIAGLAREKNLIVHVDFTMRYSGLAMKMRDLVRSGAIGNLATATVFGLHPLNWGSRPGWYFEPGKQGGTINDIMIHGFDMLRWITGKEFSHVLSAAAGPVKGSPAPEHFQQSAQSFLQMEDGARMMGDCSYLAPAGHAAHWRFFLWGSEGHLAYESDKRLILQRAGEPEVVIEQAEGPGVDPFEDFAREVEFGAEPFLGREECFRSTMVALTAQQAADTGATNLAIPSL